LLFLWSLEAGACLSVWSFFHSFPLGGASGKFSAMTKWRVFILSLLMLALAGMRADAALFTSSEKKSYDAAHESFRNGFWERAEVELADFIKEYPNSEKAGAALLLQAEAAYRQRKFDVVTALLEPRLATAGDQTPLFLYWIGSAQLEGTNYPAAATTFGRLAREFPTSPKRLEAAVNEAAAVAKLGQWTRVEELLKQAGGPFRQAELNARGTELAARGFLLLAEAQLELELYPDAEVGLKKIAGVLGGDLEWRRRDMLCRTLAARGKVEEAATESAGLIGAAEATHKMDLMSGSVVFRADLLERLQRYDEAINTLRRNLTNTSEVRQREALTRMVALELRQGQVAGATKTLETYLLRNTNAPAADVAWLTLGELHLKQQVGRLTNAAPDALAVNHLSLATNCLWRVVKNFPGSAYVGKAHLDLGWCYWVQTNYAESATAFAAAVRSLPMSEDLAVARFKLADAQFQLTNYPAALENYRAVLQIVTNWPAMNVALRLPASYQALRASLKQANGRDVVGLAGAEEAMRSILATDAQGSEAASSVLLVAQAYADAHQIAEAQRLFGEFISQYPNSELRPEVELLLTRMREEQGDWVDVMQLYQTWLAAFPTNRLRAQVEFQLALAPARSGAETNALKLFTNFVTYFPTHELAPRAQWWVADFYFGRGLFGEAEIQYKQLFQTWKTSELALEAKMMAGRAAYQWSSYPNAIEHFTSLTTDTNCPSELRAQAYFAYGGVLMKSLPTMTNKLAQIGQAREVFSAIVQNYPTNELVAQAWGEIGNCSLLLAVDDVANYVVASNAYHRAASFPGAGVAVRSQAWNGLAVVLEKQAALQAGSAAATNLLEQARDLNLNVYWDKHLAEGELPSSYWKQRAGLEAARLSEGLGEWAQAINLYRDLARQKLGAAEVIEKKIANAEKQLRVEEKINGAGI
jgi:TolA-binding protein